MAGKWIVLEAYPLYAATCAVVGLAGFSLARNITGNPEVRVLKENRTAGVLENFEEGEKYATHRFRKYLKGKRPEVMPNVNEYFRNRE